MMTSWRSAFLIGSTVGVIALVLVVMEGGAQTEVLLREPTGIMGTECRLALLAQPGPVADEALRAAEARIRRYEALLSTWIDHSVLSQLNAAGVDEAIVLPTAARVVIAAARQAHSETAGAFDATCRPLVELWRQAAEEGELPTPAAIAAARAASRWSDFIDTGDTMRKTRRSARLDLGGIAKGAAIDAAIDELQAAGFARAVIDIGGDVRCLARPSDPRQWIIGLRDPFGAGVLMRLRLHSGAVCTSGDYARFNTIAGTRYSHIIDPRSGRPAALVPSATVVAPSAIEADIWATALSVLGPAGLDQLPEGFEAMLILGTVDDIDCRYTPGFLALCADPADVQRLVDGWVSTPERP